MAADYFSVSTFNLRIDGNTVKSLVLMRFFAEIFANKDKSVNFAAYNKEDKTMARPIRETPILYGEDARRFEENMRRVESMSAEQRRANREKLEKEYQQICKEWNLTYVY